MQVLFVEAHVTRTFLPEGFADSLKNMGKPAYICVGALVSTRKAGSLTTGNHFSGGSAHIGFLSVAVTTPHLPRPLSPTARHALNCASVRKLFALSANATRSV